MKTLFVELGKVAVTLYNYITSFINKSKYKYRTNSLIKQIVTLCKQQKELPLSIITYEASIEFIFELQYTFPYARFYHFNSTKELVYPKIQKCELYKEPYINGLCQNTLAPVLLIIFNCRDIYNVVRGSKDVLDECNWVVVNVKNNHVKQNGRLYRFLLTKFPKVQHLQVQHKQNLIQTATMMFFK